MNENEQNDIQDCDGRCVRIIRRSNVDDPLRSGKSHPMLHAINSWMHEAKAARRFHIIDPHGDLGKEILQK